MGTKWDEFKNDVGIIALFIFAILGLIGIIYLFVVLIENPVSLAILCLTIFLIWIWSSR